MYFDLNDKQREIVRATVRGREVHDLGSGPDMPAARFLAESGASCVYCVDKEPAAETPEVLQLRHTEVVLYGQTLFENYRPDSLDLAFVSWPCNWVQPGLTRLLKMAHTIVYVGQNTDYSACGFREMFEHFLTRPLLAHEPHKKNTLLVLGPSNRKRIREPVWEEQAALDQDYVYFFDGTKSTW